LTNMAEASLPQMADPRFASKSEIAALGAWSLNLSECRERLLEVADNTLPSFGPIIDGSGNEDDAIFVQLSQHKMAWGTAVLRLKYNRTKLRSDLFTAADQIITNLNKMEEEQLNGRATILSSVIRAFP
jgi:hypothetical protein